MIVSSTKRVKSTVIVSSAKRVKSTVIVSFIDCIKLTVTVYEVCKDDGDSELY